MIEQELRDQAHSEKCGCELVGCEFVVGWDAALREVSLLWEQVVYSETLFPPLSDVEQAAINDVLREAGYSRDRMSADMGRRCARLLLRARGEGHQSSVPSSGGADG